MTIKVIVIKVAGLLYDRIKMNIEVSMQVIIIDVQVFSFNFILMVINVSFIIN